MEPERHPLPSILHLRSRKRASGTHHVIFSIGYALQELGYKILNDIAWEKPNPPPNLSCRYFTHSTETILWAARDEKSKHVFNYQEMRKVTGKQMKTVWRGLATESLRTPRAESEEGDSSSEPQGKHQSLTHPHPGPKPCWFLHSSSEVGRHE